MLKKELGLIDWNEATQKIHNQIRGLQPWPSAFTHFNGKMIKIWDSRKCMGVVEYGSMGEELNFVSGSIVEIKDYVKVKTGSGYINIYKLQPENKGIINAKDWVNGARVKVGDKFE